MADWSPAAASINSYNGNNGSITIGTGGSSTQDAVGTCTDSVATHAWYNGRTGKFGASLNLDGVDDYVTVPNAVKGVQSVSVWVKPSSTTQSVIDLDGGTHTITVASGTVSAGGFSLPTIYVDGKAGSTIADTNWHMITVVTSTAFDSSSGSNFTLGKVGSNYFNGQLDDFRVFSYPLTAVQVRNLYSNNAAIKL